MVYVDNDPLVFVHSNALLATGVADVQAWWPDEQAPPTKLKVAAGVGKVCGG